MNATPRFRFHTPVAIAAAVVLGSVAGAQTRVTPPSNNYTLAQDVELGRKAAAEAEQQLPIMRDELVTSYLDELGRRLTAAIDPEFRHPEFRYTFRAVNLREINAFALPGGPMFVNRGMIEAAKTEGEVAGVMAHELSHVVLRHGTAQASKAAKYEAGELAGAVLGAIIGGGWGRVIAQGTQFGLGTAFLRFGREFEEQADIEGAHIMARAGYEPRDMANMFKTIEQQSGPGGPEWLSDHPNPGNRYEYIVQEAQSLQVQNPVRDTRAFERVKAHLAQQPPAPTAEQATRNARPAGGGTTARPSGQVEAPSTQLRTYSAGNLFRVSVPENWPERQGSTAVIFAPDGGYGTLEGRSVFTHGMEIGVARNETRDLQTATARLIESFAESNPKLRQLSGYQRLEIDGRTAFRTELSNVSEATGQPESISLVTGDVGNGSVLYAAGVAPRDEYPSYRQVFDAIIRSIRLE